MTNFESSYLTEISRVPDLKEKCLEQCEIVQLECILACNNDVNCISDCIRHATDCIEGCFKVSIRIEKSNKG